MRRIHPLVALAAVALAACGSGGPRRDEQGRAIASSAGLSRDVADVLGLALRGASATSTVTYATKGAQGADVQVTIAQRPPDRRIDTFLPDGSIESTIYRGDAAYQCTKAGDWVCGSLGSGSTSARTDPVAPEALSSAVDALRASAAGYDFRVEPRSLLGVDGRCLITDRKAAASSDASAGQTGTICFAPDGTVLVVETPTAQLRATAYAPTVTGDPFSLPAAPAPSGATIPASSS